MQIKKRLTAINKRITPFIESMNQAKQMEQMCKRFEQLLDYCEAKEEKHKEREKTGMSMGMRIDEERRRRAQEIADIHAAEAAEMMKDQEQAKLQPESVTEEEDAGGEPAQADEK